MSPPVVSFGLVAASIDLAAKGDVAPLLFALGGVVGFTVSGFLFRRERRFRDRAIRPEEAAMLREIDVRDAVLVSVWVVQGWATTGRDRGAMWVEEGRLVFSGARTSFALPWTHAEGVPAKRRGPGDFDLRLCRPTRVGPLALSIAPLVGDRPFAVPIDHTVARWLGCRGEFEDGGQWPPLTLGPDAPNAGRLRGRWTAERCGWTLATGFLGLPFARALGVAPPFEGLVAVGFLLSFAWPGFARARAIEDRRILEEG